MPNRERLGCVVIPVLAVVDFVFVLFYVDFCIVFLKAVNSLRDLGTSPSLPLSGICNTSQVLVHSCITPNSASVTSWPRRLCASPKPTLLIRIPVSGFRACLDLVKISFQLHCIS